MKTKRFLSFTLLLCIVALFAGCNNGNEKAEEPPVNIPKVDLNGYICPIIQDAPLEMPFRYLQDTLFADMALERIKETEENLNCKIELKYENLSGPELSKMITASIGAGTYLSELIYTEPYNIASPLAHAGCLYPYTELKDIVNYDDSEKYGSAAVLEAAMVNSEPYILRPMSWPEKQPSVTFVMVVNEGLIKSNSLTDPRELVEKKQWTWDKFEELLPVYTLDEGENTIYALNAYAYHWVKMAMFSNGVQLVDEIDGTVKTDIYSDKAIEALNWVKKLLTDYKDNLLVKGYSWDDKWNNTTEPLINGEALMTLTEFQRVFRDIAYKVDDFGIVPFPCGPQGTYGKWAAILEGTEGFSILANANEPESAAQVVNAILEPFKGYEDREKLLDYYSESVLYDRRDAELFLDINKFAHYSYAQEGGDSFFNSAAGQILNKSSSEIVQQFGSQLEKVADEYIIPNYPFMKEHLYK